MHRSHRVISVCLPNLRPLYSVKVGMKYVVITLWITHKEMELRMNIQVNTGNHIEGGERFTDYVSGVLAQAFSRFSTQLTHVDVHFSDQNSSKTGTRDKRCLIEVRITGRKSTAVSSDANSIDEALLSATEKMKHSIENTLKRANH